MTEAQLQKSVVDWLHLQKPDALWFAVPNEGKHHVSYRVHQKAMGVKAGVADLVFIARDGQAHLLELKAKRGSLSSFQKEFRDECLGLGIPYRMCRSFEEVQGALKGWGLVS